LAAEPKAAATAHKGSWINRRRCRSSFAPACRAQPDL